MSTSAPLSQSRQLQRSLLEYRLEDGSRPIGSLIDLANFVFEKTENAYSKAQTMVPMLSEVLRGKREGSQEIIQAILCYVSESLKLSGAPNPESVLKDFRDRLQSPLEDSYALSAKCSKPDVSALLRQVRTAESIVAVLPPGVFSDDVGRRVLEEFCVRIGLLGDGTENQEGTFSVELWFRDDMRARKWWFLLLDFLIELDPNGSEKELAENIVRLNAAKVILVKRVNSISTGAKVIVANPGNVTNASGFSLYISRQNSEVSLSTLGAEGTADWVTEVYEPTVSADSQFVTASEVFGPVQLGLPIS